MDSRRVVESTFGHEVVENSGLVAAEPGVRVGAVDPVLGVGERTTLGGGRCRHGGHRTAGRLLVALGLLLATLVPGLAVGGPAQGKDKVVFHVAMLGEGVDSLNPFVGIQSPSYEMWGLTYDYLVGYSMTDMSPIPDLATKWTTSSDGKTWTFTVRTGVKFSDGVPLTAADVAYTFNGVVDLLPDRRDQREGTEPHHRRDEAEEAERDPSATADPDRPSARVEECQRERGQDLPGRAQGWEAGRG
jgi:hypothetical protein